MSNTEVSAGGLLGALREAFNFGPKKPPEVPAVTTTAPMAGPTPTETLTPADFTPIPEPTATMVPPELTATPALTAETAVPATRDELPDWLQAGQEEAVVDAPLPEVPAVVVKAPAELPAVEALALPPEERIESDPFATSREFNEYMETIRQAQEALASGTVLNPENKRKALIAVARSNSLLPKLPSDVLKSVLLMRAVASGNPKFGRDDFQLEMLAAMDIIKGKK